MIRARSRFVASLVIVGLLSFASPARADTGPARGGCEREAWRPFSAEGFHGFATRRPDWLTCPRPADRRTQTSEHAPKQSSEPTAPGKALPAKVLNLKPWKLTGPVDGSDFDVEADEIKWPALGTFRSTDFFHTNRDNSGVVFRANAGGDKTPGSVFARSELRERNANGTENYNWSNAAGTHTMTITQAVTHLPPKVPKVVVGQIHDPDDEVLMVRLDGQRLYIEVRNVDGTYVQKTLTDAYRLGTKFQVKIIATKSGIRVDYNGAKKAVFKGRVAAGPTWYFKAGCYLQSNTTKGERPDGFGESILYRLAISHT